MFNMKNHFQYHHLVSFLFSMIIVSCNFNQNDSSDNNLNERKISVGSQDSIEEQVLLDKKWHDKVIKFYSQLQVNYIPLYSYSDFIIRICIIDLDEFRIKHLFILQNTVHEIQIDYYKIYSINEGDYEQVLSKEKINPMPIHGFENLKQKLLEISIDSLFRLKTLRNDQPRSYDGFVCNLEILKNGRYKTYSYKIPIYKKELNNFQIRELNKLINLFNDEFSYLNIFLVEK